MGVPAAIVYALCTITSGLCTWLLLRAHRSTPLRLLFWSAACFLLLTLNNIAVFFDMVVVPQVDLSLLRLSLSLLAVSVLIFGFVWDI